ncbi:exclusion suppressor FxsA [Erwinia sp. J316]|uniref:Exclusion suppressor FxsA n=1 Tax=Erwinia sorbitola TaxID=2681984 RepID=A0A6I6EX16_9GAMM|nr:exclusion suppressor FxsA [Erwinia sorbitola]QGU89162.1 exclusion suppressor FxsA [Erwinia sorbitola]
MHSAGWPLIQENTVRWLPFLVIFALVWIEISLFIQVAHVMGVLVTMLLVIFTSCIGISLVKNQGMKNFMLMQQKLNAGESPAAEMIKSVSLILAGFLLLLPGFFTDFLGLLLLLPPVQKHLTLKLMPHLKVWRGPGAGPDSGFTVDGEYERKDSHLIEHDRNNDKH